ncbi:MAG: hypothetical protein QOJ57_1003 [Thermoleophilaceae bacterium]|jgi:hypothetical protein|nr:hypothetical protein [Thermoleophilaceae bacterium]
MRRLFFIVMLAAALALPAQALASGNVFRTVPGNPADKLARLPIDDYRYDHATKCLKHTPKGTLALQSWLGKHAGGVSWGIMRCEKWGKHSASLHAEGRAVDWHLDVHNGRDRAEAKRLIDLFLAPDKAGNEHALARRMGIQELIWDCKSWWSGSGGMEKYSACYDKKGKRRRIDDTNAHRDHIHIGVNWAGARMQSSFWARN